MIKVLFLCHGNICRSPLAEYLFNLQAKEMKVENKIIGESKAISYEEIGNEVYYLMQREVIRRGLEPIRHYASHFDKEDYKKYDYIFYMDSYNFRLLSRYIDDSDKKIFPITMYNQELIEIEDPWYSGKFQKVFDEILLCTKTILNKIIEKLNDVK